MKILIDSNVVNLTNDQRLLIPFFASTERYGIKMVKVGLLDRNGNIVVNADYDFVLGESVSTDDIIILGKEAFINDKIPYSVNYPYTRCCYTAYNVRCGLILDGIDSFALSTDKKILTVCSKSKWGAIDSTGKWIIPYGKYTWIDGYDKGFVRARKGYITNGQVNNDANWSLVNDNGFAIYQDYYDILPFYNRNRNSTKILKERGGEYQEIIFQELADLLRDASRQKPDYDPYDNKEWLHRFDSLSGDAFDGESDAYWNVD